MLKVAKIKDANYGFKDDGNADGVSGQSVIQSVIHLVIQSFSHSGHSVIHSVSQPVVSQMLWVVERLND